MKIYHLPVLLIFWGILSFGMSIYFSIVSVKYFVNLSLARDRAERMVSFNREGNKHIGIITVSSDDLYYFNWYPKVVLSANFKGHLKGITCMSVFTNSKGNIKKTTLNLSHNLSFKLGEPLTLGDNIVELYFEPEVDNNIKLVANLIFAETSNIATPWMGLIKAILSILFFFAVLALLLCLKHKRAKRLE